MKVMIYIEPLIEIGTPRAKSYWVHQLVPPLVKSIKAALENDVELTLVSGQTFTAQDGHGTDQTLLIDPLALVDLSTDDPDRLLTETLRWPEGPQAIKLASALRGQIRGQEPDLIIAFGTPAYLRQSFPKSIILFHEFSFFKSPGPPTWYFDPTGPGGTAWLDAHWDSYSRQWRPSGESLRRAQRYRNLYRANVLSRSPRSPELSAFQARFDHTILLPLQIDGVASFAARSPIGTQFNLALACSNALPSEIGLVLTEHPRPLYRLNDEAKDYLLSRGNVFFAEGKDGLDPSDSVAPHVDGIATVSSTTGLLSLLWGKTLISISGRYMTPLADQCGLPPWEIAARDEEADLQTLAFLMTHFAIPAEQLQDPLWMKSMLLHVMKAGNKRDVGLLPPVPEWKTNSIDIDAAWRLDVLAA